MRKNYPKLSIDLFDQSIVLESVIRRMLKRVLLFLLFYLCVNTTGFAQCNSDIPIPFIENTFGNLSATGSTTGICVLCTTPNANRLTDANLNNVATAIVTLGVANTVNYRVTDNDTDYQAGKYVGYRIDTGGLLSLDLLGTISIRTYLNGVLRETASGSSLLGVGLLNNSGNNHVIGFNTTLSFDAIEISKASLLGVSNSIDVYYPVIRDYCIGAPLNCNTPTAMSLPAYPVSLEPTHTGVSGVSLGNILDANNVISASTTDYATIALTAGLLASGSIAVKDQLTNYSSGTYAGFEIENSSLLNVSALGNVVITTYLEGVQQQQFSGNNLVVNGSLLNNPGKYKVGFVSTTSFDEVQITINQTLALNLGTTRVYNAVFQSFCAGPDLICNTQTTVSTPTYPVYINGKNTGIDGLVCALCSIDNTENLIDQNATNFAQINLGVSVGNSGSISVKDQITDYPIGSYAGFTIENPSLLNVNALDAVTIRTYLDGVLQEIKSGNAALASVGTNILVGSSKNTIGFVTTKAFDETRITITNLATVNLGVVNVYNAVFQELCPVILECNKTYTWTNPTFPVIIDSDKTGVDGVLCAACAVNNTNNVLTASTTDFASILITAGVISPASIAVLDPLSTYPVGTYAGFTIRDLNSLIQLDLFSSLTISTYLDGAFRESRSASQLLHLSLLAPYGSGSGIYNVGFQTTQSFDEIRISVGSLASVINDINVYGAFVNTANVSGGTLFCAVIDAIDDSLPTVIGATGNSNAGNVLNNDTINAAPVTINDINLTITTAAIPKAIGAPVPTIDTSTGIISIPPGTPAGSYTIIYQICYKLNSLTCDSATVTINVGVAAIDAVNDDNNAVTMVNGTTGGNAGINVYSNDTLNGAPLNANDVIFTSTPKGPLTVNEDGSVIVAPNTPGGFYTVDYTICEKLNPSNCDTATITIFVSVPKIAVVKIGSVGSTGTVGDLITYTFTVTNTGNTTLSNVVINDPLIGPADFAVTPSTLAPNTTGTATATYTIQQLDVDEGSVTNSATVSGTTSDGGTVTDISGTTITTDDQTVTTLTPNPRIALLKIGAVGGTGTLGDIITYTFTVTNTGNTTLSNIVIDDVLTGSVDLVVTPSTLMPGEIGTAIATYIIQQLDVDNTFVTNSATATGTPPIGADVTDLSGTTITTDDATITTLTPNPKIALVKEAAVGGTGEVGYVITYTFTVTNTGNTTLNNIVINDPLIGSSDFAVTPSTLMPGEIGTALATYIIQQSDMDAGRVTNSATVTGTPPIGAAITDISGTSITNDTPTETLLIQNSGIALIKEGLVEGTGAVNEQITYTFTVTNTGNTTLNNVFINDELTSGTTNITVAPSTLAPNETGTATANYVIKQSDIDAGQVTNSATVTGTPLIGAAVTDISGTTLTTDDDTVTTLNPNSSIALVKEGLVGGTGAINEQITYTFTVTNTGNTTLNNVFINDALTSGTTNITVTPSTLPPNEKGTATATYVIKQSDIDLGKITNSATVTGTPLIGAAVTDISGTSLTTNDDTVTTLNPNSSIALVKEGLVGGTGAINEQITYTFTVTNTGNTTLNNVFINDALTSGTTNITVSPSTLAPNQTGTATATYDIKQLDIDAGQVTNSATVKGTTPTAGEVSDTSGTLTTNDIATVTILNQNSTIALVKQGTVVVAGDKITYTFTVTNTGNTTLTNINIDDPLTNSVGLAVSPSTLAPQTTGTATVTYTIKQSDFDAGQVSNTATVKATPPTGPIISDISGTSISNDIPTVTILNPNSRIALVKVGVIGGTGAVGDIITYTFTVTNTGNTTLTNVNIDDALTNSLGVTLNPATLLPNATGTATAIYTIQQSDINAGKVTNSATVKGTPPTGPIITDISGTTITNDTPTVTLIVPKPSISLVKDGVFNDNNGDGFAQIGETITYSFSIINTGNLALTDVVVTDNLPGLTLTGVPISLAIGETNNTAFKGEYTIIQQDIINGSVTNQAIVTATNVAGIIVSDMSDDNSILQDDATVLSVNGCVIEVFNALSPGNDGYHDFFRIRGIECYPKNKVEIYNRWGIKVYDAEGYNNTTVAFRGVSEGRGTVSQSNGLPTGTYFYIIKYQDANGNGMDKSGYLDLNND